MAINHHLPRFLSLLGSEHISILEIDSFRRAELASRFLENDKIEIVGKTPDTERFDLVLIATPPKFHYKYYCEFEDSTDHFFIEKPMTLNADQATSLETSSKQNGQKVFVNLVRRTLGSYRLIRQLHNENYFGKLKRVIVNEGGVFNWKAVSLGSFSRDLNGGGVLMDTGPHTLDLLFQVFENISLESAYMDGSGKAIEANCTLDLIADESVPVTVNLSRNRYLSNTVVFEFARATCTVGVRDNAIEVVSTNGVEYTMYPSGIRYCESPTFAQLIDAFYHSFLVSGDNSGVGPSESLKVLKLIDSAYDCAKSMKGGF